MDKNRSAVYLSLIGDAISLGSHWVYDTDKVKKHFPGVVSEYRAPEIAKFHQGKKAGDFTQYGEQAFALLKSIYNNGGFDLKKFRDDWMKYIEENILEIIKEMGQLRTENEINYFDKYADGRFDSIVEFYQKLQKKEKPLIRLGRFSGYMDKSLGDEIKALDKNLLMSIVRDYYRKYSPRDFPVTRLLLKKERNNKEEFSYPPGWAEMELSKKRTAELD